MLRFREAVTFYKKTSCTSYQKVLAPKQLHNSNTFRVI
jgi:hypothetical protein